MWIDLGVKDLVVTSDDEKFNNPKELAKREKRLKRLQRKLSRQERNSNNDFKTKEKIARLHSKIKNTTRKKGEHGLSYCELMDSRSLFYWRVLWMDAGVYR